jgi:threonine dehydrogenase-like Zn-dependent dehydrogenase
MTGPRKLEVLEVPDPQRKDGELLVKITRVTICGSDLHEFRNRTPRSYPWAPGNPAHECLGIILECEPDSEFSEGEMVLVRPPGGGLRELAAVRPSDIISVQDMGFDPDEAVMAQLLVTIVHCGKRLGNLVGKSVFILGQGPAGLTLTNMVKNLGAEFIVTCDLVKERLEESKVRGAHETILGGPDLIERLGEAGLADQYDVVIEAVGAQETVSLAPKLVKLNGFIMFFGIPGHDVIIRPRDFFGKQPTITTTEYPNDEDFKHAIKLMSDGRFDMARMVTHRIPFTEVQRGFDLADTREDGVLRVVLDMES